MGAVTNGLLKFLFKPQQPPRETQMEGGGRSWSRGRMFQMWRRRPTVAAVSLPPHIYTNTHKHLEMPDTLTWPYRQFIYLGLSQRERTRLFLVCHRFLLFKSAATGVRYESLHIRRRSLLCSAPYSITAVISPLIGKAISHLPEGLLFSRINFRRG